MTKRLPLFMRFSLLSMRIRFLKRGHQRVFLDLVIESLNSPSLSGLLQFGFDLKYSSLKNYYSERRLMSMDLILEMCEVAKLDFDSLEVEEVGENWGQIKGGKVGRR